MLSLFTSANHLQYVFLVCFFKAFFPIRVHLGERLYIMVVSLFKICIHEAMAFLVFFLETVETAGGLP